LSWLRNRTFNVVTSEKSNIYMKSLNELAQIIMKALIMTSPITLEKP
jgi:hypothetical protein